MMALLLGVCFWLVVTLVLAVHVGLLARICRPVVDRADRLLADDDPFTARSRDEQAAALTLYPTTGREVRQQPAGRPEFRA